MNFELEVPTQQPTGEMTEMNLLVVARIFWPHGAWESQKRFYYDPDNRRKFYKVDCYSDTMKIIWEYEGPDHYEDVWKLKRIVKSNLFRGCWLPVLALALLPATYQGCCCAFFGDAYSEKISGRYRDSVWGH